MIDITLCSGRLIGSVNSWKVNKTIAAMSDHNGITFNIYLDQAITEETPKYTFFYKASKADWTKFEKTLTTNTENKSLTVQSNNQSGTLNRQVLMDAISDACRVSIPPLKKSKQKISPCLITILKN